MASVTFDQVSRIYNPSERPAVDNLDLTIEDGEFLVLVGPSGCGKSTTLRMLAGLDDVNKGTIRIGSRDVTDVAPKDRDIAMVFQNYALYPHMSVYDNMCFGLKIAGVSKDEQKRRVNEAAKLLDLEQFLDRKPKALSGGQRQRVAMGRAIVREPQVFLMDEPLSNLDAKLRVSTRTQIAALQRRLATTTVYVTHDQVEAMTMGDRVAVLKAGVLQQCAEPRVLYEQPANAFVAGFIGSPAMNLFTATVEDSAVSVGGTIVHLEPSVAAAARASGERELTVGFRPESLERCGDDPAALCVEVSVIEELGSDAFVYGSFCGASGHPSGTVDIIARVDPRDPPRKGERLNFRIRPGETHLFSGVSGLRLTS